MSCVHVVEVEWVHTLHTLLYLRRSLGGIDSSRIPVFWIAV